VVSGAAVVHNKAGLFGAYAAGFLNDVFGVVALLCPLAFGALGAACISPAYSLHWLRWCGFFLMTLCLLVLAAAGDFSVGDLWGGGMVGSALHNNASHYLSPGGSALLWLFVALVGTQLAGNISWFTLAGRLGRWLHARWLTWREKAAQKEKASASEAVSFAEPEPAAAGAEETPVLDRLLARWRLPARDLWTRLLDKLGDIRPTAGRLPRVYEDGNPIDAPGSGSLGAADSGTEQPDADAPPVKGADSVAPGTASGFALDDDPFPRAEAFGPATPSTPVAPADAAKPQPAPEEAPAAPAPEEKAPRGGGVRAALAPLLGKKAPIPLPGLDLLAPPTKTAGGPAREDREARGKALIACLKDFDIQGELVRITPGPVVTMYEVRPAPGIRVSRIANLSDDLSLALKAIAVRIQAPIPGTDTVGIEIPNENRETVNFRELAACEAFRKGCGPLTMILGKDIAGQPYMADLTRMPHLLVAGATGAGKSVCLNGILISLLYRTQPEDLQLLLVDPKRIEMAVYADEPHLVHPVVTEMSEAKNALDWAVHEMDRRYEAMARLGVRNVAGFNQKLAAYKNDLPSDFADLEPLPYLVIVIDELADLMMTAAREVETSIVRLAQLARAAGIHMILATQRPSVDVVTGLIKANFPCRISFQVTSKHDSRTILDQVGAEHLLGRGDMLFKPSGGRLLRLHGPFLSDEEVQRVVAHWKRHLRPSYKVDFAQWSPEAANGGSGGGGGGDAAQDPLYSEVQVFVSEQGRASISLVQRRFKIGFNRAARLVEQLEQDGIIGPADGSKPRAVVK